MLLNRANILFLIVMLLSGWINAQHIFKTKTQKGFEALEIHNYFKAKQLFEKAIKKNKIAAGYGLSIIYARNNNPFYNLDSAVFYIQLADSNYVFLSPKKKEKLCEINIDILAIQHQLKHVDSLCFEKAILQHSIDGYNHFIVTNKNALQHNEAIKHRNALSFQVARDQQHSSAITNFITRYPDANEIQWAEKLLDSLIYKEYTTPLSIQNLEKFLVEQPSNAFFSIAEEQLYEIATQSKTENAYFSFIQKYPNNTHSSRAWRNIYSILTSDYNPESIKKFIKKYPQYPYLHELEKDFQLAKAVFYPFMKNNKWGFLDEHLKEVIPATYQFINPFYEGVAAVKMNNKIGFIDKSNKITVPFKYDEAENFINGLAVVGINEKFGIINKVGEEIVPLIYDEIGTTKNQFISVELDEKYGFIDRSGKLVVGLEYESVGYFNNGLAYVKKNNLYGIIDTNLYYVVKHQFDWIDNLDNDFIRVRKNELYGVINSKGEVVLPIVFQQITEPENGLVIIVKDNLYGYVNTKGDVLIPLTLPYTEGVLNWALFSNQGYARYAVDNKMGLIDTTGKKFLPALFEDVGVVSKKLIAIKRNGKWGYCDYNAKLKIPYNFSSVSFFKNGLSIASSNYKYGLINETGTFVLNPIFDNLQWFNDTFLLVEKEGLVGLISIDNKEIVPIKFKKIQLTTDKKFIQLENENELIYQPIDTISNP